MIVAYFQDNDDLSMPTYRVSLLCPLSKARMSVAARGVACTHIQCFDLKQYLEFQVQNSLWACPIAGCSKQLRLAQLRVDQYFCGAIDALRKRPEVAYLDLLPNGDYAAVEPLLCQNAKTCRMTDRLTFLHPWSSRVNLWML
ncbi:e3 SUMO-protein ligase PIAS1-like protein [Aphelenchoides avenae]|nr:e3 SUMO-protein ligase PIAS1-like protein [Aphelenchus avenae]